MNTYENSYIKANKVAVILDVSPRTITRWCCEGRFPGAFKTAESDGQWRIPTGDIEIFINNKVNSADKDDQ